MVRCWDPEPEKRPSMADVVNDMNILCEYFPGGDKPIVYHQSVDDEVRYLNYSRMGSS